MGETINIQKFIDQRMLLNRLVGERGFEPPTLWSRTRLSAVVL